MSTKIVITVPEKNDQEIKIDVNGDITDMLITDTLISAYVSIASRVVATHNCGEEDCTVVSVNRGILAAVHSAINMMDINRKP